MQESDDTFDQYSNYFEQCLRQDLINYERFNHLMSMFLDCQEKGNFEDLHQAMTDMRLDSGYIEFNSKNKQKEKELIEALIYDATIELQKLKTCLDDLQSQYELIQTKCESFENRIRIYQAHDNPRLMKELNEIQSERDKLNSALLLAQQNFTQKETEIKNWKTQLVN